MQLVTIDGGDERARRISVCTRLGKRPIGRPRKRWEGSIKMDVGEVACMDGRWMERTGFGIRRDGVELCTKDLVDYVNLGG